MDQNAPFGSGTTTTSCSSDPYTNTERMVGGPECGWGITAHATTRLNASAAQ